MALKSSWSQEQAEQYLREQTIRFTPAAGVARSSAPRSCDSQPRTTGTQR